MATMLDVARETRANLKQMARGDDIIWTLRDDAPEWVAEVVYAAHGDMMPDDWRYGCIVDCLDAIIDDDGDTDAALAGLEPDIYTGALLAWVSSGGRTGYCDDALERLGVPDSLAQLLSWGQSYEIEETFDLLAAALEERAAETEDEETDGD